MSKIENPSGIPDDDLMREGLIDRLSQYLAAEPGAWHVRYNLGVAMAHEGRLDEALEQFGLVLKDAPKHMQSLVNIGGIHLSRGDAGEALKAFSSALMVWDVPVVRANLAVAYLQLDRLEEAERELRRALAMDPKMPDALTNLGSLLLRRERYAESAEASRQALELSPDFAMACNNLALALLALEQVDQAREQAARAKELGYPVHPDLLASLGL
ncbi:MAG: tetratricopeptide repeat protein [Desulfarculus sp.]|nr:tetratricopeptide repeat protein [Desulfarculus sp.]